MLFIKMEYDYEHSEVHEVYHIRTRKNSTALYREYNAYVQENFVKSYQETHPEWKCKDGSWRGNHYIKAIKPALCFIDWLKANYKVTEKKFEVIG
jgi:hypothetical protein